MHSPVCLRLSAPARISALKLFRFSLYLLLALAAVEASFAASVRGVVTDPSGARVSGAKVLLIESGKTVSITKSGSDGSFNLLTGAEGRFFLLVSASGFRQLEVPGFFASRFDSLERNLVLEPEWVRESIVVTASGVPTPQSQTTGSTSVIAPADLEQMNDLVNPLRMTPGAFMVQSGQLGAQSSVFFRGGNSTANKVLLDGASVEDLGGQFDLGPLSTTAVERAEIFRGPDSNLYGAGAASGVVNLTTEHGTTSFPSILLQAEAGNLSTSREQLELAGAHGRLDYLGAFSWLQTDNDIPMDRYHLATSVANLGWQPTGNTQLRATVHYGVDATGVPNAWDFYQIPDDRKEGDQNLLGSLSLDNQTTASLHNHLMGGLVRKREQSRQWYAAGVCVPADSCDYAANSYLGGNYYGKLVTIKGANGYKATGQALLNYSTAWGSVYPNRLDIVNQRDEFVYQGDFRLTPHLVLLGGFQWENERATEKMPVYSIDEKVDRTNDDWTFGVHGDFKGRLFYDLGMAAEHYQLIGNGYLPRAGVGFYAVRPRAGIFSGTRLTGSFGQAIREPKLTDELGSLYDFMRDNGGSSMIAKLHISPLQGPTARTWEGGGEQTFWSQRILFRVTYFHNQYGREIELVGKGLIPELLPNLTAAEQKELEAFLNANYAYSLDINSMKFRAQGIETSIETGIGSRIFFRGGYTYLDAVVEKSFSSDNAALLSGTETTFDGIPVGVSSPLKGARPFRRPPHTGYFTASYAGKKLTGIFDSAFASRSDDSTFLGYMDVNQGNTLVLPNRNLDHGYASLGLGGSYQLASWLGIYVRAENLMNSRHIAPIGYSGRPFTVRSGIKIDWGHAGR
jgi:iron complex outermembrane receptor protein/vitamin B12 transporter